MSKAGGFLAALGIGGALIIGGSALKGFGNSDTVPVEDVITKEKRTISIVNETNDPYIIKIEVLVGEGTPIITLEDNDEGLDLTQAIKIDKKYNDYDTFTIRIENRYNGVFKKTVQVKEEGWTEIVITESDRTEKDKHTTF